MIAVLPKARNISDMLLIAMAVLALCRDAHGQCEGEWAAGSLPGLNGNVQAMTVFDDGTGNALYVGGTFTAAGDIMAARIAMWDGSLWSALGSGMSGSSFNDDVVNALTVFDDGTGPALYAAGEFVNAGGVAANNIAKWDGKSWSALGSGMNNWIETLMVFDDGGGPALYAGGSFTTAGGVSANRIAKWDGKIWSALGSGMNHTVRTLTVFDDGGGPALYAGGVFSTAGGVNANQVARWDGASWSAVGSGSIRGVTALTVFDDGGGPALYAGGTFGFFSPSEGWIAEWDGSNWFVEYTGNEGVTALTVFDDGGGPALYVGGWDETSTLKWDGWHWSALGWGNGTVHALTAFDDGGGPALYAGGEFTTAGGAGASHIAKWDPGPPGTWSALGSGMNGYVSTLAVFDDGDGPALYAGGVGANGIAKWNPGATETWSLGARLNGDIETLTVFDDGGGPALYAGGWFSMAGGISANHVAKWDGKSWSALGAGVSYFSDEYADEYSGVVRALAVFDDGGGPGLYAGGHFSTAGDVSANGIAKWDGLNWSPVVRTGVYISSIYSLAVFDDGDGSALYAGGEFGIAKWDGSTWSALGGGLGGQVPTVFALAVFNDGDGPALYAGGVFSTAGGVSARNIAKWDGTGWSALGSGMDGYYPNVQTLTVFDDGGGPALYAGGRFTVAGGVNAKQIAKWDGASWSALGLGLSGATSPYYDVVYALAVFDDGSGPALYAGGSFTTAGGSISAYFARWSSHTETDAAGFAAGMTGPTATPDCKPYDYDCDGDVDLRDYTRLLFRMERN